MKLKSGAANKRRQCRKKKSGGTEMRHRLI
jgi:hypothetical protein